MQSATPNAVRPDRPREPEGDETMREPAMMNIPKRYIWVAAGAVATFAIMAVRNRMADREMNARTKREREGTSDKETASPSTASAEAPASPTRPKGAKGDLDAFLAGDMWLDEAGWKGAWERDAIGDPAAWIREVGVDVLKARREALKDHPALLAGCRRRFIVVCRYAAIDVGEAADLWNKTDG